MANAYFPPNIILCDLSKCVCDTCSSFPPCMHDEKVIRPIAIFLQSLVPVRYFKIQSGLLRPILQSHRRSKPDWIVSQWYKTHSNILGHIDNMRDDHFSVKLGIPVTFLRVWCACVTVKNPIWRTLHFKISISHTAVTVTFGDSYLS